METTDNRRIFGSLLGCNEFDLDLEGIGIGDALSESEDEEAWPVLEPELC